MALTLEEQMNLAAGYSEKENEENSNSHNEPVTQETTTTEYKATIEPTYAQNKLNQRENSKPIKIDYNNSQEDKEDKNNNSLSETDTKKIIINSISVYEKFIKLNEIQKSVIKKFLDCNESDKAPEIIEKLINFDKNIISITDDFISLLHENEIDRAFLLMSFDGEKLIKLSSTAEMFIPDYKDFVYNESNKIAFAKHINEAMNMLPEKALSSLDALKDIINY